MALARLSTAVDAGRRRVLTLRFDPAIEELRDDPRVASLAERVTRDMSLQRSRVGAAPLDSASPG